MSLESVNNHLKKYSMENHLIYTEETIATVSDAAKVIGCMESDIGKTMSFMVDERVVVILMPGDRVIDNHKYKEYFGKKAKMIPFEEVKFRTSHEVGGVTPYGLPIDCEVYLDKSLNEHEYIYPAGGSINTFIKLTIDDLKNSLNYKEIDVTKNKE